VIALWLLFLLAPGSDGDVRQRLQAAQQAEQKQDYTTAGAQYQAILAEHPEMAAIRQSLALTYHLRNQFTDAISEFQRAVAADPTLWGSFLFLGMDYYKTNQFEKAIGALQKSVALNGKMAEPEARFWLGASEAALGRQSEALREFRRAAELRPKDIEVLYQLAKASEENASATFQKIGQLNPRAAVVSLLQAERFASENRGEQARAEYRVAVTLRPDLAGSVRSLEPVGERLGTIAITGADAKANFELAQFYAARGDAARARQAREVLAVLPPADAVARQYATRKASPSPAAVASWTRLFQARTQSEAYECETAETALKELLARDAHNLDVLLALGKNYQRWAESVLRQMIAINPDSYRVHQLTGEQQEQKTEYQKALASYQTALAKQSDLSGIRFAIGQVYWKMQQSDEAERWLLEELKRNPHHGLAHYRLGSIYTERGKADEAIEHLTEALQSHPGMTAAEFDLGRALVLKARYSDAVNVLLRVAAADPDNDRVHYVLANAYRKMGKAPEAQAEFAKYQELSRKRLTRVQKDIKDVTESLEGKP
jgi:tetratricopeptide (TPR) repeat protein